MSPPWMTRLEVPAVKALMRVFPQSVSPKDSIASARRMMLEDDVRHLPVAEGDELVGLVSEPQLSSHRDTGRRVGEVMSNDPLIVDLNQPVDVVLLEMSRRHLEAALVTRGEHLAGVFSVHDGCRGFARLLQHRAGEHEGDDGAA